MKWPIAPLLLICIACTPRSGGRTPVPAELLRYATITPTFTPPQPEGLVISNETPLSTPTPFTYSVQVGDTLSAIAERFRISLDDLRAANPDVSPNSLSIGQVLLIPSHPTNPTGESTPTPAANNVRQIECYPTADRGLWCFALIHNDYAEPIENVSAQVSLLDAHHQSIASQTAFLPLNILPPNESLPLSVFFAPVVPADAEPRVQMLTAVRLLPDDERYLPAAIQNPLVQISWSGRSAKVTGQVLLPAESRAAGSVWIAATAYDSAGRVVGMRRWESQAGLTGGNSLPFSFMVASLAGELTRVELAVEARP